MSGDNTQDGWKEYKQLVLAELTRLNTNDERIMSILQELTGEVSKLRQEISSAEKVNDGDRIRVATLEQWKNNHMLDYTAFKTRMLLYVGLAAVVVNGFIGVCFWLLKNSFTN